MEEVGHTLKLAQCEILNAQKELCLLRVSGETNGPSSGGSNRDAVIVGRSTSPRKSSSAASGRSRSGTTNGREQEHQKQHTEGESAQRKTIQERQEKAVHLLQRGAHQLFEALRCAHEQERLQLIEGRQSPQLNGRARSSSISGVKTSSDGDGMNADQGSNQVIGHRTQQRTSSATSTFSVRRERASATASSGGNHRSQVAFSDRAPHVWHAPLDEVVYGARRNSNTMERGQSPYDIRTPPLSPRELNQRTQPKFLLSPQKQEYFGVNSPEERLETAAAAAFAKADAMEKQRGQAIMQYRAAQALFRWAVYRMRNETRAKKSMQRYYDTKLKATEHKYEDQLNGCHMDVRDGMVRMKRLSTLMLQQKQRSKVAMLLQRWVLRTESRQQRRIACESVQQSMTEHHSEALSTLATHSRSLFTRGFVFRQWREKLAQKRMRTLATEAEVHFGEQSRAHQRELSAVKEELTARLEDEHNRFQSMVESTTARRDALVSELEQVREALAQTRASYEKQVMQLMGDQDETVQSALEQRRHSDNLVHSLQTNSQKERRSIKIWETDMLLLMESHRQTQAEAEQVKAFLFVHTVSCAWEDLLQSQQDESRAAMTTALAPLRSEIQTLRETTSMLRQESKKLTAQLTEQEELHGEEMRNAQSKLERLKKDMKRRESFLNNAIDTANNAVVHAWGERSDQRLLSQYFTRWLCASSELGKKRLVSGLEEEVQNLYTSLSTLQLKVSDQDQMLRLHREKEEAEAIASKAPQGGESDSSAQQGHQEEINLLHTRLHEIESYCDAMKQEVVNERTRNLQLDTQLRETQQQLQDATEKLNAKGQAARQSTHAQSSTDMGGAGGQVLDDTFRSVSAASAGETDARLAALQSELDAERIRRLESEEVLSAHQKQVSGQEAAFEAQLEQERERFDTLERRYARCVELVERGDIEYSESRVRLRLVTELLSSVSRSAATEAVEARRLTEVAAQAQNVEDIANVSPAESLSTSTVSASSASSVGAAQPEVYVPLSKETQTDELEAPPSTTDAQTSSDDIKHSLEEQLEEAEGLIAMYRDNLRRVGQELRAEVSAREAAESDVQRVGEVVVEYCARHYFVLWKMKVLQTRHTTRLKAMEDEYRAALGRRAEHYGVQLADAEAQHKCELEQVEQQLMVEHEKRLIDERSDMEAYLQRATEQFSSRIIQANTSRLEPVLEAHFIIEDAKVTLYTESVLQLMADTLRSAKENQQEEMRMALRETEDRASRQASQLAEASAQVASLEEEVQRERQKCAELDAALATLRRTTEESNALLNSDMQRELEKQRAALSQLQEDAMESERLVFTERMEKLRIEHDDVKNKLREECDAKVLKEREAALREKQGAVEAERAFFQAKLAEQMSTSEARMAELRVSLQDALEKNAKLVKDIESERNAAARQITETDQHRKYQQEDTSRIRELENLVFHWRERFLEQKEELLQAKADLRTAQNRMDEQSRKLHHHQHQHVAAYQQQQKEESEQGHTSSSSTLPSAATAAAGATSEGTRCAVPQFTVFLDVLRTLLAEERSMQAENARRAVSSTEEAAHYVLQRQQERFNSQIAELVAYETFLEKTVLESQKNLEAALLRAHNSSERSVQRSDDDPSSTSTSAPSHPLEAKEEKHSATDAAHTMPDSQHIPAAENDMVVTPESSERDTSEEVAVTRDTEEIHSKSNHSDGNRSNSDTEGRDASPSPSPQPTITTTITNSAPPEKTNAAPHDTVLSVEQQMSDVIAQYSSVLDNFQRYIGYRLSSFYSVNGMLAEAEKFSEALWVIYERDAAQITEWKDAEVTSSAMEPQEKGSMKPDASQSHARVIEMKDAQTSTFPSVEVSADSQALISTQINTSEGHQQQSAPAAASTPEVEESKSASHSLEWVRAYRAKTRLLEEQVESLTGKRLLERRKHLKLIRQLEERLARSALKAAKRQEALDIVESDIQAHRRAVSEWADRYAPLNTYMTTMSGEQEGVTDEIQQLEAALADKVQRALGVLDESLQNFSQIFQTSSIPARSHSSSSSSSSSSPFASNLELSSIPVHTKHASRRVVAAGAGSGDAAAAGYSSAEVEEIFANCVVSDSSDSSVASSSAEVRSRTARYDVHASYRPHDGNDVSVLSDERDVSSMPSVSRLPISEAHHRHPSATQPAQQLQGLLGQYASVLENFQHYIAYRLSSFYSVNGMLAEAEKFSDALFEMYERDLQHVQALNAELAKSGQTKPFGADDSEMAALKEEELEAKEAHWQQRYVDVEEAARKREESLERELQKQREQIHSLEDTIATLKVECATLQATLAEKEENQSSRSSKAKGKKSSDRQLTFTTSSDEEKNNNKDNTNDDDDNDVDAEVPELNRTGSKSTTTTTTTTHAEQIAKAEHDNAILELHTLYQQEIRALQSKVIKERNEFNERLDEADRIVQEGEEEMRVLTAKVEELAKEKEDALTAAEGFKYEIQALVESVERCKAEAEEEQTRLLEKAQQERDALLEEHHRELEKLLTQLTQRDSAIEELKEKMRETLDALQESQNQLLQRNTFHSVERDATSSPPPSLPLRIPSATVQGKQKDQQYLDAEEMGREVEMRVQAAIQKEKEKCVKELQAASEKERNTLISQYEEKLALVRKENDARAKELKAEKLDLGRVVDELLRESHMIKTALVEMKAKRQRSRSREKSTSTGTVAAAAAGTAIPETKVEAMKQKQNNINNDHDHKSDEDDSTKEEGKTPFPSSSSRSLAATFPYVSVKDEEKRSPKLPSSSSLSSSSSLEGKVAHAEKEEKEKESDGGEDSDGAVFNIHINRSNVSNNNDNFPATTISPSRSSSPSPSCSSSSVSCSFHINEEGGKQKEKEKKEKGNEIHCESMISSANNDSKNNFAGALVKDSSVNHYDLTDTTKMQTSPQEQQQQQYSYYQYYERNSSTTLLATTNITAPSPPSSPSPAPSLPFTTNATTTSAAATHHGWNQLPSPIVSAAVFDPNNECNNDYYKAKGKHIQEKDKLESPSSSSPLYRAERKNLNEQEFAYGMQTPPLQNVKRYWQKKEEEEEEERKEGEEKRENAQRHLYRSLTPPPTTSAAAVTTTGGGGGLYEEDDDDNYNNNNYQYGQSSGSGRRRSSMRSRSLSPGDLAETMRRYSRKLNEQQHRNDATASKSEKLLTEVDDLIRQGTLLQRLLSDAVPLSSSDGASPEHSPFTGDSPVHLKNSLRTFHEQYD